MVQFAKVYSEDSIKESKKVKVAETKILWFGGTKGFGPILRNPELQKRRMASRSKLSLGE